MPEDHDGQQANQQQVATFELYYDLCPNNKFWSERVRDQPRIMHLLMRRVVAWAGNGRYHTGIAILNSWRNLFERYPELKNGTYYLTQDRSQEIMGELLADIPRHPEKLGLDFDRASCPNCFVCGNLHCSIRHGKVVIVDANGDPLEDVLVTVSDPAGGEDFSVPLLVRLHVAVPFGAHRGDDDLPVSEIPRAKPKAGPSRTAKPGAKQPKSNKKSGRGSARIR